MAKKEHIGFQLDQERPIDKKVIDILNSLPQRTKKCAYIRQAIIFYDKYKDMTFENGESDDTLNDDRLDLVLRKLDDVISLVGSINESEEESHRSRTAPVSDKKKNPEKVQKEEKKEEPEDLPVVEDVENEIEEVEDTSTADEEEFDLDAYEDSVGDFL